MIPSRATSCVFAPQESTVVSGFQPENFYQFRFFEVNGKVMGRSELAPYFEHLAGMDCRVFVDLVDGVSRHTTEPRLSELRIPTLVVAGDRDTFTPPGLSQTMHDLIPDSELLMIPGGTHTASLEIPELVHLRLDRFLDKSVLPRFYSEPRPTTRRRRRGPRRTKKVLSGQPQDGALPAGDNQVNTG